MAVLADHRRWRRLEVGVGSSVLNEPDAAEAFLARLVQNGVRAEYVDTENGKMGGRRRLRCRAPDAEAVIRELEDFLEDR